MKNTLWRIGDSWSQTSDYFNDIELNHSYYIAEHYSMNYKNIGQGGFSNLDIFNTLLLNDYKYKKDDIILINFASTDRIGIYDNGDIHRTSTFIPKNSEVNKVLVDIVINDLGKPISDTLFFLIKNYINSLLKREIKVYHFYNDFYNVKHDIDNELIFHNQGFIMWCKENRYENLFPGANFHYKVGSQKEIAKGIIEKIESL